jgi:hypothetical protein
VTVVTSGRLYLYFEQVGIHILQQNPNKLLEEQDWKEVLTILQSLAMSPASWMIVPTPSRIRMCVKPISYHDGVSLGSAD